MNWLHYLLEANLYLAVFYAFYYLFLNSETHYTLNRIYLLLSCIIAFILPVMQIGTLKPVIDEPVQQTYTTVVQNSYVVQPVVTYEAPVSHFTLQDAVWYAYLLGIVIMALILIIKISRLIKMTTSANKLVDNKYKLIALQGTNAAFSFFNYLFIGSKTASSDIIIRHELVHIRQKHSADIVFMELIKIVSWFNPIIYFMEMSLKTVHEYIADEQTAAHETDALTYSSFLVNNAYGLNGVPLSHSFFNYNLLKKRIIMLNQKRSGNLARLKYLAAVPICAGMLCASTLAFSKNYGWVDLAPAHKVELSPGKKIDTAPTLNTDSSAKAKPQSFRFPPPVVVPNGYSAILHHLNTTLKYPKNELSNKQAGFVAVTFNIDAAHKVTDVKIAKSSNTSFGDAVSNSLQLFNGSVADKPGEHKLAINFFTDYYAQAPEYKADIKNTAADLYMFVMPELPPPPPAPPVPGKHSVKSKLAPPVGEKQSIDYKLPPPSIIKDAYVDLFNYLNKTVKYPAKELKVNKMGQVAISFTVKTDHKLTDIKIIKSGGSTFDDAVIGAVKAYNGTVGDKPGSHKIILSFFTDYDKFSKTADGPSSKDPSYSLNMFRYGDNHYPPMPHYPPAPPAGEKMPPPPPPAPPTGAIGSEKMPPLMPGTPSTPLGNLGWYIQHVARYPTAARENGAQGAAYIKFDVDNNHKISNVTLVKGPQYNIGDDLVKRLPNYPNATELQPRTYKLKVIYELASEDGTLNDDINYKKFQDEKGPFTPDVNVVIVAYKKPNIGKINNVPPAPPKNPADSLHKYISKMTRYPASAYDNQIGGRVILVLTINNGKIADVKLARPLFDDIDNEVIRVLKSYNGPLDIKSGVYSLPVSFAVVNEQEKPVSHLPENYTQKNKTNNINSTPSSLYSLDEVVIWAYPRKKS